MLLHYHFHLRVRYFPALLGVYLLEEDLIAHPVGLLYNPSPWWHLVHTLLVLLLLGELLALHLLVDLGD